MAQIIPTNKYGNVYYGPKTFDEAMQRIEWMIEDGMLWPDAARDIAETLEEHGYSKVAEKVRAEIPAE